MQIKQIQKRDERVVPFDPTRIESAVLKALKATKEASSRHTYFTDEDVAREITDEVCTWLVNQIDDQKPTIEQIQDLVEKALMHKGYHETAKAYIVYREQHRQMREMKGLVSIDLIDSYLNEVDWRIKENANTTYSVQAMNNYIAGTAAAHYWLEKLYPAEVRQAHINGDMHIHDLDRISSYCTGWDIRELLQEGFKGQDGRMESRPPKHFRSALGQTVNYLYTMQNETAGAEALSNVDTMLAPFIAYDGLTYPEVKQAIQEWVFNLNVPTRAAGQVPFTNITLDLKVPQFMANEPAVVGGKPIASLGDFQKEMDMFNLAFTEVLLEGDAKQRGFTFPIPTYNLDSRLDFNDKIILKIFEVAAKYGSPYFANFFNSDLKPEDVRSMCLFPKEVLLIKENGVIKKTTIGEIFLTYKGNQFDEEWFEIIDDNIETISLNPKTGKLEWAKITKFLKVYDDELVTITTKDGKTMKVSKEHLIAVFVKNEVTVKKAKDVNEDDLLLVLKDGSNVINTSIDKGNVSNKNIEWLRNSDFAVVKVKSINQEKLGYKQVFYDIELEKNHYFVHSDGNITHNCCRLKLDTRELVRRGGGFFGSLPQTGSIGVCTINLPLLGYLAKNESDFFNRLSRVTSLAVDSLEIKRKVLERLTTNGLYPYSRHYLQSVKTRFDKYWSNHFSTIGVIGGNEACLNLFGENIGTPRGKIFARQILEYLRNFIITVQERTGNMYNLEATPGEGCSHRLARTDKAKYPDIIVANEEDWKKGASPYYTNSTMLPVNYTDDIYELLTHQEALQTLYTGGSVTHVFLGEKKPDYQALGNLVCKIFKQFKIPYLSLTPTYSVCPSHGYFSGEKWICPECGSRTEVYSRVVGYYRPVQHWNDGKREEFKDRKLFQV